MSGKLQTLEGTLERIVYSNEDGRFIVAEFASDAGAKLTITGSLPGVQCGEYLRLEGEMLRHPSYGDQFKVASFEARLPAGVHGIRKYLGSGLVSGIGKAYAKKIVDHFGEETLKVISEESARLREVPGIGKERARAIKQAWEQHRVLRSVMIFLQTYGVSPSRCQKIVRRYGEDTEKLLREEPYRLASEIDGIGFRTADKIAVNLGLPSDGPARIEAGLLQVLRETAEEGGTALPRNGLLDRTEKLLGLERRLVEPVLDGLLKRRGLVGVAGDTLVQEPGLAASEAAIAAAVTELLGSPSRLPPIVAGKAVEWAAAQADIAFAPEQAEAVRLALGNPLAILTGGPGTGKTTILRALVRILAAKKVRVGLASPTGRAAQRLAEATGREARTLHRLLEFDPSRGGFVRNRGEPLDFDFVIVDEASMLDTRLAAALFAAVRPGCHLLLVGDADQLPSVGPGSVLRDLIGVGRIPVVRLRQVFRQDSGSGIVSTAYGILAGSATLPVEPVDKPAPLRLEGEVQWILAEDAAVCADLVVRLVRWLRRTETALDPVRDVQVLAPIHKGDAGVHNLNTLVRQELNDREDGVRSGGSVFAPGDKVIQGRNNYDLGIFNGDTGIVLEADPPNQSLRIDFAGNRVVVAGGDLSDLSLAYAMTIHKSQGSEYPVVILPLVRAHFILLQRNLLYTAVTRARRCLFFVGDPSAFAMGVRKADAGERVTDLARKIG